MADFKARVRSKRDTSANWTSANPVLLDGEEIIVDTESGEVRKKIGNGVSHYTQLPFTDEKMRTMISEKVPSERTVNGKSLKNDISLTADDVDALSTAGGTLTGDLTGQNITGTWLQTTAATNLGRAPVAIPVLDSSGWLYKRTPSELLADIGGAGKTKKVTTTLTAAGWSASAPYTQTLQVSGITADSDGDISIAQNATAAQREAAWSAIMLPTAQGDGSLTITADGTKPEVDIPVLVRITG